MKLISNFIPVVAILFLQSTFAMEESSPDEDKRINCPVESIRPLLQGWVAACDGIAEYANQHIIPIVAIQSGVGNIAPRKLTEREAQTLKSWQNIQDRINNLCLEGLELASFPLFYLSETYWPHPPLGRAGRAEFRPDLFEVDYRKNARQFLEANKKNTNVFLWGPTEAPYQVQTHFVHLGHGGGPGSMCFFSKPNVLPDDMKQSPFNNPNAYSSFLKQIAEFGIDYLEFIDSQGLLIKAEFALLTQERFKGIYPLLPLHETFQFISLEAENSILNQQIQSISETKPVNEKILNKLTIESISIECKLAEEKVRKSCLGKVPLPKETFDGYVDGYEKKLGIKEAELDLSIKISLEKKRVITEKILTFSNTEPVNQKLLSKLTLMTMSLDREVYTAQTQKDFILGQKTVIIAQKDSNQHQTELIKRDHEMRTSYNIYGIFESLFSQTQPLRWYNLAKLMN